MFSTRSMVSLRVFSVASALPAAVLIAMTTVAAAQETPGRFAMKDIEGGILRMDTKTGRISQCKKKGDQWACESIADDSSGLEDRISELKKENDALRTMLADAEKAQVMVEEKANKEAQEKAESMPKDEELDRVMAFIEKFMRRFFDFAKSMRDTVGLEA